MACLTKKEEDRRVVFLHVPVEADEGNIVEGVDVTIELIRAIVQSGELRKLAERVPQFATPSGASILNPL